MFNDDFYLRYTFLYGNTHQMDVPLAAGFWNLYGNDRRKLPIQHYPFEALAASQSALSLVNNTLHVIIYGQHKVFVEAKQNIWSESEQFLLKLKMGSLRFASKKKYLSWSEAKNWTWKEAKK